MTNHTSVSGDRPDEHEPIEDPQWVRSVVSEALVHANTPLDDDDGWSSGIQPAHQVTSQEPLPQADFSEVSPEAIADSDWVSHHEVAPVALPPLPPPVDAVTPQAPQRSLPTLDTDTTTYDSLDDAVMVETKASVEGYRASELRTVVEWLLVIFLALVVAVLAKEFVVQAFWIPTASMETTVNVGDRVLVNKVSYRVNDVRRGDLVVFGRVEGTPGNTEDLIKRAVALPGETIELRSDGRLWIWGPGETPADALLLDEPYLDAQNALLTPPSPTDGPTATIWHDTCVNDSSNSARCTLDSESYFMLGDNRGQSFDSRGFGPVPEDNIVGRAFFRIWPLSNFSTL